MPFEHGVSYTIHLVPFKHTLQGVLRVLPNIASGLKTPMENIIIEQHPDSPKDPTVLRMQIITNSPIEETVYFDRPRHEGGRVLLGLHADGIGEAFLRVYTKNRMHNSFTLGSTASGKSRLIETIAVTLRDPSFPPTVIFYIDGQNGVSSPSLFRNATWSVGMDDVETMMDALERIAAWRNRENFALDSQGFTPTEGRPGIAVIVDECHDPFKLLPERFANAARKWNKLGISIHGASQDSNIADTFGGKDILRSSLIAGNCIAMRVTSRIAGNLIPGLDWDPYDFPILPGYGVTVIPPGGEGRTAGFRGRYSPDEEDRLAAEVMGEKLPVPTIEEWFLRYPPRELDRGAARAAGLSYLHRHEIAAQKRAQTLALVQADDDEYEQLAAAVTQSLRIPSQRIDRQRVSITTTTSTTTTTHLELTAESRSFAEAVRSLDWDGGLDLGTLMSQFPQVRLGVAKPAIESLVIDGELVKDQVSVDGGRTQDVYRKALPAGQAKKVSAREAILSLPWQQHLEMDRGDIIAALRTAGHQHSEASIDQALRALCTANPAVLVKEPGRGTPYRLA